MLYQATLRFLRLGRADSAAMAFSVLFLPQLAHGVSVAQAFFTALPIFPATLCTFILNDLADKEDDLINHPGRPIPSGEISELRAIIFYFFCLVLSIFIIFFIDMAVHFKYMLLIILYINYDYLKKYIPNLKTVYVAVTSMVPIFILEDLSPADRPYDAVAISMFLMILARENLMDVIDREGDADSLASRYPTLISVVSFLVYFITPIALLAVIQPSAKEAGSCIAILVFGIIGLQKWLSGSLKSAITLLKWALLPGLMILA